MTHTALSATADSASSSISLHHAVSCCLLFLLCGSTRQLRGLKGVFTLSTPLLACTLLPRYGLERGKQLVR
jgi:hypothetical protein